MPSPRVDGVGGHRDFRRLWAGSVVGQFGSAIGMVALPVIAVVVLDVSAWQVSLLAGITALTTVLVAFHVGHLVEYTRKRPVMIGGDLIRAVALASLPVAHVLGALTYAHLCAVAAVNAVCAIAFTGASQAHLKSLVSPAGLIDANSRLESTRWLSISLGPALAGALIAALSAVGALVATTVGHLFGALAVRTIREPEPPPPDVPGGHALGVRDHGLAAAVHSARGSGGRSAGRSDGALGRRGGDGPGRVSSATEGVIPPAELGRADLKRWREEADFLDFLCPETAMKKSRVLTTRPMKSEVKPWIR
ncbi:MFS transporter [Nocardiopsis alba]|uniref:MFS transporter n=1 Tax=Nocardiopsis alba TaxID=53437 RepID=UPI00340B134F